jgi:FKBP-type peptidyl-prolyl cis-trans isomerase FklB
MKKLCILALCFGLAGSLAAQASPQPDVSYSLGMLIGANLKTTGLEISTEAFLQGMKDVLAGKATKYSDAEAQAVVQASLQAAAEKKGAASLAAGRAFLEANGKKKGVVTTASGLQYLVLTAGAGPKPKATDTVKVNYEGKQLDGSVFDSSIARNEPATFPLDGVIPGWTEGVQLMPVGSKYRFFVPSDLAYGDQGAGNVIGPNAVLVFEIELLSIEAPQPQQQ